jgi:predicted Zn-dependent protease with MMP-like domain
MSGMVQVERLLDEAEAALDAGDAERALDLCNQVLSRASNHPGAHFVKGDSLRIIGELGEAADAYRAAALIQPDHAASWASLALTSFDLLDFEEARRAVSRAARESPRNPEAWWVRSLLQEWRGDFAGAQRSLAHAQWIDPVGFPMPPTLTDTEVERMVQVAISKLHPDMGALLTNVPIILDEIPSLDVLLQYHPPASPLELLGHFSGAPLLEKSTDEPWSQIPATIVLFRRNLARNSSDRSQLIEQLRFTLAHEVGHFLGLDGSDLKEPVPG